MPVLALDIGGTNLKSGIVIKKKVSRFVSRPSLAHANKKTMLAQIEQILLLNHSKKIRAIAISMPGPADWNTGTFGKPKNLPLARVNLKKIVQKKFGVPVTCMHDAHAFALGETAFGAGVGKRIVLGVTLGTGIGMGLVINGRPFYGTGNAGELGHAIIDWKNGKTLEDMVGDRKKTGGVLGKQGGEYWFERARKGDRIARAKWNEFGRILGIGLATAVLAYAPDVVVIGGNVAKARPFFQSALQKSLGANALHAAAQLRFSRIAHAALLGAAHHTRTT